MSLRPGIASTRSMMGCRSERERSMVEAMPDRAAAGSASASRRSASRRAEAVCSAGIAASAEAASLIPESASVS